MRSAAGHLYALKKIDRRSVEQQDAAAFILRERMVHAGIHHPMVVRLVATFRSSTALNLLLEPCLGGELYEQIRTHGALPPARALFYAACALCALGHLHERKIVYRDLKPENCLIASNGYLKLVDLGLARRLDGPAYTLCGTPDYVAPEMIAVSGHGTPVDLWALGVLIFELLMGHPPFIFMPSARQRSGGAPGGGHTAAAPAREPMKDLETTELYRNILDPAFPLYFPHPLSREAHALVCGLLQRDPTRRLGCYTDVRRPPFRF